MAAADAVEIGQTSRAVDVGDPDSAGVLDATRPQVDAADPKAHAADPKAHAADPEAVERLADQMLAELAAQRDDVHRLTARLPGSRAGRAVLVTGVVLVGTALIVLAMFVLGSLG